ncbi:MAG: metallophosphoesterase [Clostridia bacterium]|nr:metallophosphoesterase [Clostridia bacterium]
MYKLFVVSDIHGHATLMKQALTDAGFNPQDPSHLFICCGDCFDRGSENRAVLEYIQSLPRKVLIRGNHEDLLAQVLRDEEVRGLPNTKER